MKKILSAFCLLLAMPLAALAASYTEGDHYTVLANLKKSEEPSVREAFSVYCPACYQWDQGIIGELEKRLESKEVDFKQTHVQFMGKYADKISQALAVTKGTDKYKPVKDAFFEALHEDRIGDWKSDEHFFEVLAEAGLSKREWAFGVNDPEVRERMQRWEDVQSNVRSVPSFIVNNKYLINLRSIKTYDEFYSLIDYLLKK